MYSQAISAYAEEMGVVTLVDGEEVFPEEIYANDPEGTHDWYRDTDTVASKYSGLINVTPSEFTEFSVKIPIEGVPSPFEFLGREYLRTPYDIQVRRLLLFCGRQVEKTLALQALMSLASGELVPAIDVVVGDRLASFDSLDSSPGVVVWKSKIYKKRGYKVSTRQGHTLELGHEHPIKVFAGWRKAEECSVGDRVAVVRKCGTFGGPFLVSDEEIKVGALPSWVFQLDKRQTSLFLNRLWATDGYVKKNDKSEWSIEYCSVSKLLVRQVQALLWKFGIPSKIRENWPNYRKEQSAEEYAYILRIETLSGVRTFLTEIGTLDKSERFEPPVKSTDELELLSDPGDVFWDEITAIEEIPELECVDFCVEPHHTFVADGFITHNSTLLGNSILSTMCIIPHFRALYVSPTHEQTKVFRRDRIAEPILLSDILQAYLSTKYANNIALIKFVNFAQLTLRYAYLTADRVRGIPADRVYVDEIQDILTDNLPVIEECAGHANPALKSFFYSGTPKSFDNTIEQLWSKRSTQNEWAVPCTCRSIFDMKSGRSKKRSSIDFWNAPLAEENMGLEGLICAQCGKRISAADQRCHWVSMNPSLRDHPTLEPFESFRIPQLMVPWIDWADILNKRESYSKSKFYNEVLAQSFESGSRPLRMEEILRNCRETITMRYGEDHMLRICAGVPLFMGIDWGNENSRTVVTIGGYLEGPTQSGQFSIIHAVRYTGRDEDPEIHVADIIRLIEKYRPLHVGVDYGGGFDRNIKLIKRFGMQRILRYQYIGGNAPSKRGKIQYDTKKGRYMLDRTEVMSDIFSAMKDDKIAFPSWAEWYDPFAMDMLNIFGEYNEITRMVQYDKSPGMTDDTFHSILYCLFASMVRFPRMDIIRPMKEAAGIH